MMHFSHIPLLTVCLADLRCFVCNNCPEIDSKTPTQLCDVSFFETSVSSSTIPTTIPTTMSTTEVSTVSSTHSSTTETSTTMENVPPTPATVNTTLLPTPPNVGTLPTDAPFLTNLPNIPLNRRRRQANGDNYTYHCYRVQHTVNATAVIERGCSRVLTNQSVCGQLVDADSTTKKCYPCSLTLCNGSTTLNVSIMTVLVATVAALLRGY